MSKLSRMILIDVYSQEVKEVQAEANLGSFYKLIGCDVITVAAGLGNGDDVYVDDEGLLKPVGGWFYIEGASQPFAGNGLIVGRNEEGDSVSCLSDLEDIKKRVTFPSASEVLDGVRRGIYE